MMNFLSMSRGLWRLAAIFGILISLGGCSQGEDSPSGFGNILNVAAAEQLGFAVTANPMRPAPVNFTDGEGRSQSLKMFRGKVVLLNLWATWCSPCREEMPTLDALQAGLGGTEFEVVALSIDHGGLAAVQSFYEETGIEHLRLYNDESAQANVTLGAPGVPVTLLLNRDGYEVARLTGPKNWYSSEMVEFLRTFINPAQAGTQDAKRDLQ